MRKVGVEEELLLVDPSTGHVVAFSSKALRAHEEALVQGGPDGTLATDAPVEQELFLQQIETGTAPCVDLADLVSEIRRGRRAAGEAARAAGAAAVAVPAPVLEEDDATITPKARYRRILDEYGEMSRQSLVCGMHVHIDVDGEDEAVAAMDGIRPWLPVLLAVSANSPYWQGRDTGFASWRSQIWGHWPSNGPAEPFGRPEVYRATVDRMIEWGAAVDPGMLYLDARPSSRYPTLEIRVCDVCTEVDDAALVAALARALVTTAASAPAGSADEWRSDLLRAASWRAARYGLGDKLVNPATWQLGSAREVVTALREHVAPALHEAGDWEWTADAFDRLMARGSGSSRQRSAFESSGSVSGVMDDLLARTESSWCDPASSEP